MLKLVGTHKDGSVADEHGFVVMGGQAEQLGTAMTERWRPGLTLAKDRKSVV